MGAARHLRYLFGDGCLPVTDGTLNTGQWEKRSDWLPCLQPTGSSVSRCVDGVLQGFTVSPVRSRWYPEVKATANGSLVQLSTRCRSEVLQGWQPLTNVILDLPLFWDILVGTYSEFHWRPQGGGGATGAMAPPLASEGGAILSFGPTFDVKAKR